MKELQFHGEAAYIVCATSKIGRELIYACLSVFEIGIAEFVRPEETQGHAIVVREDIVVVFSMVEDEALTKTRPGEM